MRPKTPHDIGRFRLTQGPPASPRPKSFQAFWVWEISRAGLPVRPAIHPVGSSNLAWLDSSFKAIGD